MVSRSKAAVVAIAVLLECGLVAKLRQQLFKRIAGKLKTIRRLDSDTKVARYGAGFMKARSRKIPRGHDGTG